MGTNGDNLNMNIDSFLYSHPVFRNEEFTHCKEEQNAAATSRTIKKALLYYKNKGRLINIRRGLYAVIPPNESSESFFIDPYLIAGKATSDSVLSYHSALELHGVAYSVFEQFTFLTKQKIKSFEFQQRWYQPTAVPIALQNKNEFGIDNINRNGLTIRVTNIERTYVDILDRVELSGGWEEVIRSINNVAVLNVEDVIKYCLMLNNRILAAKVGFFLEQRQGAFKIENDALKSLMKFKPQSPQYLSSHHAIPSQFVKKWNLIIPLRILKQSWNEPDHDI